MRRVCLGVLVFGVVVTGMAAASLCAGGDEIAPTPLPPAVGTSAQVADDAPPLQHPGGRWTGGEVDGERFWVRADSLLWWTSGAHVPPLVTTSPRGSFSPGVLGQPGTTILFGDGTVGGFHPGVRATLGGWLGSCRVWGVEADYLTLFQEGTGFDSGPRSDGRYLAQPFFDMRPNSLLAPPPRPDALLAARPNEVSGRVVANVTDEFQSAGVSVRCSLLDLFGMGRGDSSLSSLRRLDMIGGYRFYSLEDEVTVGEDWIALPTSPITAGTTF